MKQIKRHIGITFCLIAYFSSTIVAQNITGSGTTTYLPKFTGASTVVSSIINENASACIGIGTTPLIGEFVSFQKSQSTQTRIGLRNLTSGATACASFNVQSLGSMINMAAYNLSFTSAGMAQANTGVLSTTGGLNIGTTSSAQIALWTNNLSRMTINSTGEVGIGTATPDKILTVKSVVSNIQIAKFADDARYIGLGRDEVAAFDLSGNPANLYLGGGGKLTILTTGDAGIGTTTPRSKLDIIGNLRVGVDGSGYTTVDPNTALTIYQNGTNSNGLKFQTWNNSVKLISIENSNNTNSPFTVYGDGSTVINAGQSSLKFFKINDASGTGIPIETFAVYGNGNTRISGNVLIGDPTVNLPAGYKLYVQTGILTEKVKVALVNTTDWADYVFAKDYKLKTLTEINTFINANKHLPGVPSASELVEQGGFDLGKMDAKLLEKIEELTLYIIQLDKTNKTLTERLDKLESNK